MQELIWPIAARGPEHNARVDQRPLPSSQGRLYYERSLGDNARESCYDEDGECCKQGSLQGRLYYGRLTLRELFCSFNGMIPIRLFSKKIFILPPRLVP